MSLLSKRSAIRLFGLCVLAGGLGFSQPSFAVAYGVKATEQPGQTLVTEDGLSTTTSDLPGSEVKITYGGMQHNRRMIFSISILNKGDAPLSVDLPNVLAEAGGIPMRLYTRREIVGKEKSRKRWGAVAVGVVEGLQVAVDTGVSSAVTTKSYGYYGSTTTRSYDSNSGALTSNETSLRADDMMDNLNYARDQNIEQIANHILQPNSIGAGDAYQALVITDPPKKNDGKPIYVTITVGGDTHTFLFSLTPH